MKIKRGDIYQIKLYLEPEKISDHNRRDNGTLSFTGVELIDAIVSVGMPDVYLTEKKIIDRKEEIYFKIRLFETFVSLLPKGELSFDLERKDYLDSTEVGAINYWLGMILTTVLGKKKYSYEYMVHLSMVLKLSSQPPIEKYQFLSANGKTTYKSPDLIAMNNLGGYYGVFESKGCSEYKKETMEKGFVQAKSIEKINTESPKNSLVVMTVTGNDKIEIIEKDPEGEEGRIKVNLSFLQMCHYLPIVELIVELGPEEQEDWTFGSLVYEEEKYSIGIPTILYKELLPIAEGKEENLLDEFLEKISSKETYLLDIVPDEARQHILHVK